MSEAKYIYTGYFDLVADALFHWRASTAVQPAEASSSYRANRYARASIVASLLSFECAANCLVAEMPMSSKAKEDIEKLSAVAKYELFARFNDKEVDRGDVRIQRMLDLVRARNDYVHPRAKSIELAVEGITDADRDWRVDISLTGDGWAGLGIPKRGMFWSPSDAEIVLDAACGFMKWYFSDLLAMPPPKRFQHYYFRA